MATFNKFENFVEDCLKGVHDFSTEAITVVLTNAAPSATDTVLTDITQISNGGGYTAGGYALSGVTLSETSGTAKLVITDETITATGAAIATFRYIVLYNDTPTSPADPLIGYYDYGSALTLAEDESLTIDFDGTNGVFTLT